MRAMFLTFRVMSYCVKRTKYGCLFVINYVCFLVLLHYKSPSKVKVALRRCHWLINYQFNRRDFSNNRQSYESKELLLWVTHHICTILNIELLRDWLSNLYEMVYEMNSRQIFYLNLPNGLTFSFYPFNNHN